MGFRVILMKCRNTKFYTIAIVKKIQPSSNHLNDLLDILKALGSAFIFYNCKCIIDSKVNIANVNICKEFLIKTLGSIMLTFKNEFTGPFKKIDKKRKLHVESMSKLIVERILAIVIQVTDRSMAALLLFRVRLFIMLVAYSQRSSKFIFSKSIDILKYKEKKLAISASIMIAGTCYEVFARELYIRGLTYVYKYLSDAPTRPTCFYLEFLASIMIDVISSNNETDTASVTLHISRLSKTINKILTLRDTRSKLFTWYFTHQFELWSRVVATLDRLYKHSIVLDSITRLMFGVTHFYRSVQIILF